MIGETVYVLQRTQTGADRYGTPVYDWPEPGVELRGCGVAPLEIGGQDAAEPPDVARNAVVRQFTVYAPAGAPITAADRLKVRGEVYEVIGEPSDWRSPYSRRRPGLVAKVRRVEG